MSYNYKILLILWMSFAGAAAAGVPAPNEPLPPLTIDDKGELLLHNDERVFEPWHSDQGLGKVQVIQYLAARLSASKINEPFTDALSAADLPDDEQLTTTIINLGDAIWGTGGFVMGELEDNKRLHPDAVMVADARGVGVEKWSLKPESSAIIVVARDGEVLFFKQGALDSDEIDRVLSMLRERTGGQGTAGNGTPAKTPGAG